MNLNVAKFCCDPFQRHKKRVWRGIRDIPKYLINKNTGLNLNENQKVCTGCRKQLAKTEAPKVKDSSSNGSPSKYSTESSEDDAKKEVELTSVNETLASLDSTPLKKSRLSGSSEYPKKKMRKICQAVKRSVEVALDYPILSSDADDSESVMITQLKEKFKKTASRSEQLMILTVLPKTWTRKRIMEEFGCSQYMARQTKELVKEKGIFSTPNPRLGKRLDKRTEEAVVQFYKSPEVSREMPGLKDFVSVKGPDGTRERKQKHLILCNLKEAYEFFKSQHPTLKIGFSKFADLRPKECVLPGASGTHAVCVCTAHQNVKLMMTAITPSMKTMSPDMRDPNEAGPSVNAEDEPDTDYICHYRHCLALLQCNPPQEKCFFEECPNCPGVQKLKEILIAVFDRKAVDEVEFKQWTKTDRSTLQTQKLSADDFITSFCDKLQFLLRHDFIAKIQLKYYQQLKERLGVGEFLVVMDFAENYSFIVQDASQSFHWNNAQATLHPFVIYFRKDGVVHHQSFVAISDCNTHDTIAVHLFQTRLIEFLKTSHDTVNKIFYFSDGCAAQYKNCKSFLNLGHHRKDYGVEAEWHFFATSHGKGPCDGVGGSIKRLAARKSLQLTGDQDPILTPQALYDFAVKSLPSVAFTFTTTEQHEAHKKELENRLHNAKTIPGESLIYKGKSSA